MKFLRTNSARYGRFLSLSIIEQEKTKRNKRESKNRNGGNSALSHPYNVWRERERERERERGRVIVDVGGRKEDLMSVSTYNNIPKHVNTFEWHGTLL